MLHKVKKADLLAVLLIFIISFIYIRDLILNRGVIEGLDWTIPPEPLQLIQYFNSNIYLWKSSGFVTGMPSNPLWYSENIHVFLLYFFGSLNLDGEIFSKFTLLGILFISGINLYILLRYLKLNCISSFIGSVFYMSTPIFFNLLIMIGAFGINSVYAFLPLTLYFFLKSINEKSWFKYSILATISMISLYPIFGFAITMVLLIPFSIFLFLQDNDKRARIKIYCRPIITMAVLFILLQFFWLILFFDGSNPLNEMRPQNWGNEMYTITQSITLSSFYFNVYQNISSISSFTIFLILILLFASLLIIKNKIVLFFSMIIIFFVWFISTPFHIYIIKNNILFFGIFRDISKLLLLIAISYAILLGFFINELEKMIGNKTIVIILYIVIMSIIFINNYPFLLGNLGGRDLSTNIFPEGHSKSNSWINEQEGDFKILWLPTGAGYISPFPTNNQTDYNHIVDTFGLFSSKPGIITDIPNRYRLISEFWLSNKLFVINSKHSLTNILGLYNIEYLILRKDTKILNWYTNYDAQAWGRNTNENLLSNLKNQSGIVVEKTFDNVIIYKNTNNLPHVYTSSRPYLITDGLEGLVGLGEMQNFSFNDSFFVFLNQQANANVLNYSKNIIIQNNNFMDALIPVISKYLIYPGAYAIDQEASKGWSQFHQWYWADDDNYQGALEDIAFTRKLGAVLRIPYQNNFGDEDFDVFIKPYVGKKSTSFEFNVTNNYGILFERKINAFSDKENYFKWIKLTDTNQSLKLKKGQYNIEIYNNGGELVIASILVIPKNQLKLLTNEYNTLFLNKTYLSLNSSNVITKEYTFGNINNTTLIDVSAYSDDNASISNSPQIVFRKINPTKYQIRVQNATQPYFLIFNERYNLNWKVYINKEGKTINWIETFFQKPLSEEAHFIANSYANGWQINEKGTYEITLYYWPQSLVYPGLIISFLSLIGCIVWVIMRRN